MAIVLPADFSASSLTDYRGFMHVCQYLNLAAIEKSLRDVQLHFDALNHALDEPRDALVDEVRDNVLAGYALVDYLVSEGVDLFDLQQIDWMIEINNLVLCGTDPAKRGEYFTHIEATRERFFDPDSGVGDLLEWYAMHRHESVWRRAAGVFVRILSKPQLFIEGNHRSASLIVSFLLLREGYPPFVLTTDNALGFFNPASVVRRLPKKGISALVKLPKIKKRYAQFLADQAQPRFLLPGRRGTPKEFA